MATNSKPKAWGVSILSWLLPGLGHISIGRILQGLGLGGIIWALFLFGLYLGGFLQTLSNSDSGILARVFWFCNLGNGLLYFVSSYFGFAIQERPMLPYAEYGNIFLVASGLLNYFIALDAHDAAVGRKA